MILHSVTLSGLFFSVWKEKSRWC